MTSLQRRWPRGGRHVTERALTTEHARPPGAEGTWEDCGGQRFSPGLGPEHITDSTNRPSPLATKPGSCCRGCARGPRLISSPQRPRFSRTWRRYGQMQKPAMKRGPPTSPFSSRPSTRGVAALHLTRLHRGPLSPGTSTQQRVSLNESLKTGTEMSPQNMQII